MKLFEIIKKLNCLSFDKLIRNNSRDHVKISNSNSLSGARDPFEVFFENMGPQTANEIIKQRIDRCIINEYGLDELANRKRYCIARVGEANGRVIHTMLIDRQSGMVRSLCRKAVT